MIKMQFTCIVLYVQLSVLVYAGAHFCTYFAQFGKLCEKIGKNYTATASQADDIKNKWIS